MIERCRRKYWPPRCAAGTAPLPPPPGGGSGNRRTGAESSADLEELWDEPVLP
jgi:hypothetical protein